MNEGLSHLEKQRGGKGRHRRSGRTEQGETVSREESPDVSDDVVQVSLSGKRLAYKDAKFVRDISRRVPDGFAFDTHTIPPYTLTALANAGLEVDPFAENGRHYVRVQDENGTTETLRHSEAVRWLQNLVAAYDSDEQRLREIEHKVVHPSVNSDLKESRKPKLSLEEQRAFLARVIESRNAVGQQISKGGQPSENPTTTTTQVTQSTPSDFDTPLDEVFPPALTLNGVSEPVHAADTADTTASPIEVVKSETNLTAPLGGPNGVDIDSDFLSLADPEPDSLNLEGISADRETDPMLAKSLQVMRQNNRVSVSLIQRTLRIGYNRAGRLIEELASLGFVSAPDEHGKRSLLSDVPDAVPELTPAPPREVLTQDAPFTELGLSEPPQGFETPTLEEICDQYLRYQDAPISEEAKRRQFEPGADDASRVKYAHALQEMMRQSSPEVVKQDAEHLRDELMFIVKQMQLSPTPYSSSVTWAMWDMGKQYYFSIHPEEADPKYAVGNPLESAGKRQEILYRHLGWEFHAAYVYKRLPLHLSDLIARHPEIEVLITQEVKENNSLSSFDLAALGQLTHKAFFQETGGAGSEPPEPPEPPVPPRTPDNGGGDVPPDRDVATRLHQIREHCAYLEKVKSEVSMGSRAFRQFAATLDDHFDQNYKEAGRGKEAFGHMWVVNKLRELRDQERALTEGLNTTSPIESRFEKAFGISPETLQSMEGFSRLHESQKKLVLQNLEEHASSHTDPWKTRVWGAMEAAFASEKPGTTSENKYENIARTLIYGMAQYGPRVHEDPRTGELRADFVGIEFDRTHRKEERDASKALNEAAYAFARTPEPSREDIREVQAKSRWGKVTKFLKETLQSKKERESLHVHAERARAYERAKKNLAHILEQAGRQPDEIVRTLLEVDRNVHSLRFVETNPQLIETLKNEVDDSALKKIAQQVGMGGVYVGLGMVSKTMFGALPGYVGGPAVAFGIASMRAWNKAAAEERERDRKTHMGDDTEYQVLVQKMQTAFRKNPKSRAYKKSLEAVQSYEKETISVVPAVNVLKETTGDFYPDQGLTAKLARAVRTFEQYDDAYEAEKNNQQTDPHTLEEAKHRRDRAYNSLRTRVAYSYDKLRLNRIHFGDAEEYAFNKSLFDNVLAQGQVHVGIEDGMYGDEQKFIPQARNEDGALIKAPSFASEAYRLKSYQEMRKNNTLTGRHERVSKSMLMKMGLPMAGMLTGVALRESGALGYVSTVVSEKMSGTSKIVNDWLGTWNRGEVPASRITQGPVPESGAGAPVRPPDTPKPVSVGSSDFENNGSRIPSTQPVISEIPIQVTPEVSSSVLPSPTPSSVGSVNAAERIKILDTFRASPPTLEAVADIPQNSPQFRAQVLFEDMRAKLPGQVLSGSDPVSSYLDQKNPRGQDSQFERLREVIRAAGEYPVALRPHGTETAVEFFTRVSQKYADLEAKGLQGTASTKFFDTLNALTLDTPRGANEIILPALRERVGGLLIREFFDPNSQYAGKSSDSIRTLIQLVSQEPYKVPVDSSLSMNELMNRVTAVYLEKQHQGLVGPGKDTPLDTILAKLRLGEGRLPLGE